MATPRKDSTIPERVKKLEQELRRIRLLPSLSQSAVEPLAVKGSGWFDSTSGNEPKVFDGQNWVPVRDETIAVAQGTADTAQSTATTAAADAAAAVADASTALSKFPITATDITDGAISTPKLAADAIDGMVITGALFRTAASGQRVEIDSTDWQEVKFYSGAATETAPGIVRSDNLSGFGILNLKSPALADGRAAAMTLQSVPGGGVQATITADNVTMGQGQWARLSAGAHIFELDNTGALTLDGADVVTDATVSPYYYAYLAATATVNNATPTAISWTDEATLGNSGITRSGSVFTVPRAGRYRVTCQASWAAIASATGSRLASLITGNTIGSGTVLASAPEQPSAVAASACLIVKTIRLAASDQFRTQVSHTQGASTTVSLQGNATGDLTYVQVEWVGP